MQVGQNTPTSPASRPAPAYAVPTPGAAQQQAAGGNVPQSGSGSEVEQVAVLGYN